MLHSKIRFCLIAGLALLFNVIFWQEKLGLNLFIFNALLVLAMCISNPTGLRDRFVQITLSGVMTSAMMILISNSLVSTIAYWVSFILLVGFWHETALRSVFFALAYSLWTAVKTAEKWLAFPVEVLPNLTHQNKKMIALYRWSRLTVVPLIALGIFYLLFKAGNPVFDEFTQHFEIWLERWVDSLFDQILPARVVFFFIGLFLVNWVLVWRFLPAIAEGENKYIDRIFRKRNNYKLLKVKLNTLALRYEYRIGLMLMILVNVLLLVVNAIDIRWLWFGFDPAEVKSFKLMVHEGTFGLIISILLSMGIMLHYFRNNLNFYPRNYALKSIAYLWLIQNTILVISVGLRVAYYIQAQGLAYKRIGVLIFLALALFGLWTLYCKISSEKSAYYLFRTNGWAVYGMLILMNLVDWDMLIIRYNLQHYARKGTIGTVIFTVSQLADKALPIIHQHSTTYNHQGEKVKGVWYESQRRLFEKRVENYIKRQKGYSWLSWNYVDARSNAYWKGHYSPKLPRK
jgi:hypothetical protein